MLARDERCEDNLGGDFDHSFKDLELKSEAGVASTTTKKTVLFTFLYFLHTIVFMTTALAQIVKMKQKRIDLGFRATTTASF